jgi:hypothetical protein
MSLEAEGLATHHVFLASTALAAFVQKPLFIDPSRDDIFHLQLPDDDDEVKLRSTSPIRVKDTSSSDADG